MTDATPSTAMVVLERSFDAPASQVWQMWTEPEHFGSWYGPNGAEVPVVKMDVRVGGSRLVCMQMQTPNGLMQMWFGGEFLEVVANRRLVYTEFLCDENGEALSSAASGLPAGHPATTTVTVDLHEDAGHTTLVLTHAGVPADSPGAAGWAMALDKLAVGVNQRAVPVMRDRDR